MHVFIVGATGVIGQALIPRLLDRGDSIVALVRSRERAAPIALPGVDVEEGDLLHIGAAELAALLEGCDAAAHMATALRAGSPGLGTTNTTAALRIDGTRHLLDAALSAGVPRFIQQSIALSYVDGGDRLLDESTAFAQPDPSVIPPHAQMEAMVRGVDQHKMQWMILRGGTFVGPHTFQEETIARLQAGEERVPGDGSNWISPIHVEDYAEAVVLAIHSPETGVTLNITAEPIRQGDYLDHLARLLGVPAPPRDPDASRPRSSRCTAAAAERILGWRPRHAIWPELA